MTKNERKEAIKLFGVELLKELLKRADGNGKSYRKNMFWIQLKNSEKKCEEPA